MPTRIEWTDETWNPVRARRTVLVDPGSSAAPVTIERKGWHCEHASAGCINCYAETMNRRGIGTGLAFKPGHRKDVEIFIEDKVLDYPRRWKRPRTIFPGSMTDLFADFVSDQMLDRIFGVAADTQRHTYQFLTKRPDRMAEYCNRLWACGQHGLAHTSDGLEVWPFANCWMGTSVEDGRVRDRIDQLRKVPAHIRFLSIEPLIGPLPDLDLTGIHWVIVGGESGPNARPMNPDWVRGILAACVAQGAAFFFKQWGEWAPIDALRIDGARWVSDGPVTDGRGNVRDWMKRYVVFENDAGALRLRAHSFTKHATDLVYRVGKRRAGRLLDGVEHNAMPERLAA